MIEYIFNKEISIYFTPLENGKCEYMVEIHDFGNLDMVKDVFSYECLNDAIRNPVDFLNGYRNAYGGY